MTTYLLVDTNNLLFRARHVTRAGDTWERIGMTLHIMFSSLAASSRNFDVDHLVFCFEGRSWRKQYYEPYKMQRKLLQSQKSKEEREEDEEFMNMLNDLQVFLENKTNATVFQNDIVEADDCIALWIQNHPNDEHIILSTDSDFMQLINDNVCIFNGVENKIIKKNGIFDLKGKHIKKNGKATTFIDSDYLLFEKIIRGDSSDNIKPAYPGVRKKGTKNKVGLDQAFADKDNQGFDWVNFMNVVWTDEKGIDHTVKDDYERNRTLIDLTAQPAHIREMLNNDIKRIKEESKHNKMIGINFLAFCKKYELIRLSNNSDQISNLLAKRVK